MIEIACGQCGKSWPFPESRIGQRAKCPCGGIIEVDAPHPATAGCPHCGAAVEAGWRACPACGQALTPAAAAVQAGAGSIVKTSLEGDPARVSGQPLLSVGDRGVVKASIDASSNVHHHGQFVQQQTVVHESGVAAIVRLLTTSKSKTAVDEAEQRIAALPDAPEQLMSILAQTLQHLLREVRLQTMRQGMGSWFEGLLGGFQGNAGERFKAMSDLGSYGMAEPNYRRLQICHAIVGKLQDQGNESPRLLKDIEALDEALVSVEAMLKQRQTFWYLNMTKGLAVPAVMVGGLGLVALWNGGSAWAACFLITAIIGGAIFAALRVKRSMIEASTQRAAKVEKSLNEIIQRVG